ncbi:MAG: hypothetical protein VW576_08310 [Opitutae bacterium]
MNIHQFLYSLLLSVSSVLFAKQGTSNPTFALYVEIPSTKIEASHSEYARDRIAAELSRLNFRVVTPESVTQAVNSIRGSSGLNAYKPLEDNNMQALSLQLGADYFIHLSLNDFISESKDLPRFDRKIFKHRLIGNFRVISSHTNASVFGKSLSAEKNIPVTSNIIIETSKSALINELIDQIADELIDFVMDMESDRPVSDKSAESKDRGTSSLSKLSPENLNRADIKIIAKLKGLVWPKIVKDEDGNYVFSGMEQNLEATDAEIEIDGIFVGNCSADTSVSVPSGLRRLKVSRSGYTVVDKMINAHEGLTLSLLLEPSDDEYNRWREQLLFLQTIKRGEKLTDAQVKQAEGLYEFLKNSKFEMPSSVTYKTLF